MIHANCGAIAVFASTTYMTIVELFDEYPAPFSPEIAMIVIDYDTNIYINTILPPSCFLSWHGD